MKKKPLVPLSVEAERLLPAANEAPKCSVHAASLQLNPSGTGISADAVVLVDVPLPWPKPVLQHPLLHGVEGKTSDHAGRPARVFASVPQFGQEPAARVFRQSPSGTIAAEIALADRSAAEVVELLLGAHDPRDLPSAVEIAPTAILVCTQGSHDICCGSEGAALVQRINADYRLASAAVFRVSHTGGHRFAPTAMTFPDGRMWAYVDVDDLAIVLNQTAEPSKVTALCRGSWEAPNARCQAAEVAVLEHTDWPQGPITFEETDSDVVRVMRDDGMYEVEVKVAREVPVIRCRAEGGLPAKPSRDYTARILR